MPVQSTGVSRANVVETNAITTTARIDVFMMSGIQHEELINKATVECWCGRSNSAGLQARSDDCWAHEAVILLIRNESLESMVDTAV